MNINLILVRETATTFFAMVGIFATIIHFPRILRKINYFFYRGRGVTVDVLNSELQDLREDFWTLKEEMKELKEKHDQAPEDLIKVFARIEKKVDSFFAIAESGENPNVVDMIVNISKAMAKMESKYYEVTNKLKSNILEVENTEKANADLLNIKIENLKKRFAEIEGRESHNTDVYERRYNKSEIRFDKIEKSIAEISNKKPTPPPAPATTDEILNTEVRNNFQ